MKKKPEPTPSTESIFALTTGERFALLEIMPTTGSYATLKAVAEAKDALNLSLAEEKEVALKRTEMPDKQGMFTISYQKAEKKWNVRLSEFIRDTITSKLAEMNKAGTLTMNLLSLYPIFVADKKEGASGDKPNAVQ